jgi:hypothetical protein
LFRGEPPLVSQREKYGKAIWRGAIRSVGFDMIDIRHRPSLVGVRKWT